VSPFAPNGNGVLNDVVGSNGTSIGHVGGGTIVSVMNGEEPEEGDLEERDEDPNKQLEMENRRRSSAVNGKESLQDIEMS
jgi:hypothetical protein